MKVTITGGAGFIGSHLADYYIDSGAEVCILDDLSTGLLSNIRSPECKFVSGSITDINVVKQLIDGSDLIYHLAAKISVTESMYNPSASINANIMGLLNVIEACCELQIPKMVFASSSAIYGNDGVTPIDESCSKSPNSIYGFSKLFGEQILENARVIRNLNSCSLRFFNVFGPRQSPLSTYASAIPIFVHKAIRGDPLVVFGNGLQTRDFVYIDDVVKALVLAGRSDQMAGPFNVGTGQSISIIDLCKIIINLTGSDSEIIHYAARPGEALHSCAIIDKIQSIGWQPSPCFVSNLERTTNHIGLTS